MKSAYHMRIENSHPFANGDGVDVSVENASQIGESIDVEWDTMSTVLLDRPQ
jgi:hypothetical protein